MQPRDLLVRIARLVEQLPGAATATLDLGEQPAAVLDSIGRAPAVLYIDGTAEDRASFTAGSLTVTAHGAVRPATDAELDALAERFAANALELRRLEAEFATATEEAA